MSELDEWRRKVRERAISDPEEVLELINQSINPNAPKYRLELLYDEQGKLVILQGNQAGLENLRDAISRLLDSTSGAHTHFDRASGLSKNDLDLIIQKVDDDDVGAHQIGDLNS